MKNLKLKKIKIAKINNLSLILGGAEQTIDPGCMPDTLTCPPKKTQDPNDTSCQTTNGGTLRTQGGYANTEECGG